MGALKTKFSSEEQKKNTLEATNMMNDLRRKIQLEFIRLYGNSRSTIHKATESPKEVLQYIDIAEIHRWNSKTLDDCFQRFEAYNRGVVDLVTKRLVEKEEPDDYTVPNTDSESINIYINTRNRPQQSGSFSSPTTATANNNQTQGNIPKSKKSMESGGDVIKN